jgi:2-hydroxy-3-keto-5-methylthiopentenyl-1-phosphate phosphatase
MTRIVLDWDGTVTEVDGLHLVLLEFGDERIYDQAENSLGRELTLHEVIALEFRSVRAPLEEVVRWLRENVRLRAGFTEFARERDPVIVSSGFHELIEPVLDREAVHVVLHANRVDASPDGWRVEWRYPDDCDHCGESCKRALLPDGYVVYVGDGYSDRCAALASDRVFATSGLARYLSERGTPFEPFSDFHALSAALGNGLVTPSS